MIDDSNVDDPISKRRSKRSCRLSNIKSQPNIEKKDVEVEPVTPSSNEMVEEEEEEEEEDPEDIFEKGDIFWVRVTGNPWWPALIYGSYYEDNLYTKIVNTSHRRKKRRYFVYFFGPDFEYSWSDIQSMMPYSGLEDFIKQAEIIVQKATGKREQEVLANRFEMKVPATKRAQWDKAMEEADRSSKLTREERLENFTELLKIILKKSNEKKRASVPTRQSLKKTSSDDKSTKRSSVKRQKTKSTPVSTSTTLLHVGFPTLTKKEEEQIVNTLLERDQLNLNEAQSLACQLVIDVIKENFQVEMTCVQTEWFYDFLLNHREITSKHSHWFNDDIKPIFDDSIYFKQCQLKSLN